MCLMASAPAGWGLGVGGWGLGVGGLGVRVSRQLCRGVVMDGIGGLGNDTVLQLWAEAREDWNDTVAQVGCCGVCVSCIIGLPLPRASSQLRRLLQRATASYNRSLGTAPTPNITTAYPYHLQPHMHQVPRRHPPHHNVAAVLRRRSSRWHH